MFAHQASMRLRRLRSLWSAGTAWLATLPHPVLAAAVRGPPGRPLRAPDLPQPAALVEHGPLDRAVLDQLEQRPADLVGR